MSDTTPNVQYTPYAEGRFAPVLPYAPTGYLFTVPGSFPDDTPSHLNLTDRDMAVYWTYGQWEVRDLTAERRVWGIGRSRRTAVGLAFLEIARKRRQEAREAAERRLAVGLEAVPPYAVEITGDVTLICTPEATGVLKSLELDDNGPTLYHVHDTDGGDPYTIRHAPRLSLRQTLTGVLHVRCGCDPEDATRFENETDALKWATRGLTFFWPCANNPA
ncbi:hypothetical protein ACPCSP_25520 [Streptomyces cinereoruber]|uniref:hypothetical protein n=1 Tax=Streptomyces cinereoruber TaxID=67260 RepID=UPI003C2CC7E5